MREGDCYSETKIITYEDILKFSDASGDNNPIHVDEEAARHGRFGRVIAHGMLLASYISAILGMKFPGEGTIYISQTLNFQSPAFVGDELKVEVTVLEMMEKNRARLSTKITNQTGNLVLEGEAVIKCPHSCV